jgi:hypothetical protein
MSENALLAYMNEIVDGVNAEMMEHLPGDYLTAYSLDRPINPSRTSELDVHQTLQKMVLDTKKKEGWTHGHVYVPISRVPRASGCRIVPHRTGNEKPSSMPTCVITPQPKNSIVNSLKQLPAELRWRERCERLKSLWAIAYPTSPRLRLGEEFMTPRRKCVHALTSPASSPSWG